jgi:undecaprenyl-diphosphatase
VGRFSTPLRLPTLLVGIMLPLTVCAKLADDIWDREELRYDAPLLQTLHHHSTPARDAFFIQLTRSGNMEALLLFGVAVLLTLLFLQRRRAALFFLVALGGGGVLNVLTKLLFRRDRPTLWLSPAPETDYSFPSGHAMVTMSVAVALSYIAWPTRGRWFVLLGGALWTAVIGLSRMYLGVHFPSDVLAGWCAGLAWTTGTYFILRGHRDPFFKRVG